MKLPLIVTVLLSLVSFALAAGNCYKGCRFHFCDGTSMFDVRAYKPDTPFHGRLCDKWGKINLGVVAQAGEGVIWYRYYQVAISKYRRRGLRQHFSPSFFKTFSVPRYYVKGKHRVLHKYSSIGRETSQQGQINFLNYKCIVLPLKNYQILNSRGNVIKNVNVGPKQAWHQCVSFKVAFGWK